MPRPLIGPKVDFRLPEDVITEIQRWAEEDGCAHDALFRDLLLKGFISELGRRSCRSHDEVVAGTVQALTAKAVR